MKRRTEIFSRHPKFITTNDKRAVAVSIFGHRDLDLPATVGMAEGSSIKATDTGSVHRITSGQVVVDLQTAVKQLMEISPDAGATHIGNVTMHYIRLVTFESYLDIRVKENGLGTIKIVDNDKIQGRTTTSLGSPPIIHIGTRLKMGV